MSISFTIPKWLPPIVCLVVLILLYPKVSELDRKRKIEVSAMDLETSLHIENQTDARAGEVSLIEIKCNELLASTGGHIELSRTGNISYYQDEDDDVKAQFFITGTNYFVLDDGVKVECKNGDCVSITQQGMISDESRSFDTVLLSVQSAEQGDRLVDYLKQFEQICERDKQMETGAERKFKKFFDKLDRVLR
ncbi:hypothetical protein QM480_24665 [Flectobacillus sp. DC10W]|uniref:FecR protein domain-containing protein n=1 Tax=Flectobacillus longus TaxID=2984207 RepID=A0ABT6YVH3_9BACT|nr:hypothetical protein [Flectobacillus longus]MDI9867561.1 hypothetical protein [Flectobacillus longus]